MKKAKPYFRRFGFEIEFSTPFFEVEKMVKRIIPKIYGKNKLTTDPMYDSSDNHYKKWEFKYDGSTECELTTPISTIRHFTKIEKILQKLKENNVKITSKDSSSYQEIRI